MKGTQKIKSGIDSKPFEIIFNKKWTEPTLKENLIYLFTDIWLCIKNFFYEKSYHLKVLESPKQIRNGTWSYRVNPIGYTIRIFRIKIKTKMFNDEN